MTERMKMTPLERAKQFAPFAALRGHGAELKKVEEESPTARQLTEEEQRILNSRLVRKKRGQQVSVIWFDGREYHRATGKLSLLDPGRNLMRVDRENIPISQLLWIDR